MSNLLSAQHHFYLLCAATVVCHLVLSTWGLHHDKKIKLARQLQESTNGSTFEGALSSGIRSGSLRCGGVVNSNSSKGTISYKPDEILEANERCVWIVRYGSATRYFLHVSSLGSKNRSPEFGLIVSGFARQHEPHHFFPVYEGMHYPMYNSSVLVVTLFTGNGTGRFTGFSLEYEALSHDANVAPASANSTDFVIKTDIGAIKYPRNASEYGDNELTMFAFVPVNNIRHLGKDIGIEYAQLGIEDGCYDFLRVYYLNTAPTSITKWEDQGTICSDLRTTWIGNKDMVLVIFESDDSNGGPGFIMKYSSTCAT